MPSSQKGNTSEITSSQNVQLVTMFESSFGSPIMYLGLPSGKEATTLCPIYFWLGIKPCMHNAMCEPHTSIIAR